MLTFYTRKWENSQADKVRDKKGDIAKELWNSGGHYGLFENPWYNEFENLE